VYLHDTKTGTTRLMSRTAAGAPADGDSDTASVSSDGRYVAFESDANNIGGLPDFIDVFVHDSVGGGTRLVSRPTSSPLGDDDSFYVSISADGRFAALTSRSDNFSDADDNTVSNCFRRGPLS
jgi:Tol biopolymer transport system component